MREHLQIFRRIAELCRGLLQLVGGLDRFLDRLDDGVERLFDRLFEPGAGGDDGCRLAETAERVGRFFYSFLQLRNVGTKNDPHCTDVGHVMLPLPPCALPAPCTTSTLAR